MQCVRSKLIYYTYFGFAAASVIFGSFLNTFAMIVKSPAFKKCAIALNVCTMVVMVFDMYILGKLYAEQQLDKLIDCSDAAMTAEDYTTLMANSTFTCISGIYAPFQRNPALDLKTTFLQMIIGMCAGWLSALLAVLMLSFADDGMQMVNASCLDSQVLSNTATSTGALMKTGVANSKNSHGVMVDGEHLTAWYANRYIRNRIRGIYCRACIPNDHDNIRHCENRSSYNDQNNQNDFPTKTKHENASDFECNNHRDREILKHSKSGHANSNWTSDSTSHSTVKKSNHGRRKHEERICVNDFDEDDDDDGYADENNYKDDDHAGCNHTRECNDCKDESFNEAEIESDHDDMKKLQRDAVEEKH
jgi:hypothetical protein